MVGVQRIGPWGYDAFATWVPSTVSLTFRGPGVLSEIESPIAGLETDTVDPLAGTGEETVGLVLTLKIQLVSEKSTPSLAVTRTVCEPSAMMPALQATVMLPGATPVVNVTDTPSMYIIT
jgi:hypothetical protein